MSLEIYKEKYLEAIRTINESDTTKLDMLQKMLQAKLDYARQYHGPSFDTLLSIYDTSYKNYMDYSRWFDKEMYEEVDEIMLTNLLHNKEKAEKDLFGCINAIV